MKKIILSIAILSLAVACKKSSKIITNSNIEANIEYFQDSRVGLCFALVTVRNSVTTTNVPCESVKNYLE